MNPAYTFIDQPEAWERCLTLLRGVPRFSVDLEANSLHAYREQICLIQMSTDSENFILDPLANLDLSGLGLLFADPAVEKVFHAADYDMMLLKSRYGWDVRHLFDTMWAGRVLGFKKMGLAVYLSELFGVTLSKKLQKADWARRPLPQEWLDYACNDTHYLLALRDELEKQLCEQGCLEEVRDIFDSECRVEPVDRVFDPEAFWHIQGVRELPPRAQAILHALFIFRDEEAHRRNVPPFKVINDQMLMRIAEQAAPIKGPITQINGVPDKVMMRLGSRLQQAIQQGRRDPLPRPSRHTGRRQSTPGFAQRYEALLDWRKSKARERGVESDVIMARRTAVEIAEKHPKDLEALEQIETLGPYRRNRYGEDILKTLDF